MNDPLLLIQLLGAGLYGAATLSSSFATGRPRGLGLAWLALLLAIGITTAAAVGEYWVATAIWTGTCAISVYRVVQEERKAASRG